jgi:hypothetical protein
MQDAALSPLCIDRRTAARISGMSISWHRNMDSLGIGPPKLRLGQGHGRIRYEIEGYMNWLRQHQDPARQTQQSALTGCVACAPESVPVTAV